MSEGLYLRDAYLTEFEAQVVAADGRSLELNRTAFYPTGGGQPSDRGSIRTSDGRLWNVEGVEKTSATIVHQLAADDGPVVGTTVHGSVDWNRRHMHMRYHTALHVLSGVVFHRFGSGITGGQFSETSARMDFSLPEFSRSVAEELVTETNRVIERNLPVTVRFITRDEAQSAPELIRVAARLVPPGDMLRLIDIEGFDVQADGGTHVRSTAEVGSIVLDRIENKGARNKRVYLKLEPSAP